MSEAPTDARDRRDDICIHIFTASATLVGVCLTVIGVLRVVHRLHPVSTLADEFLSLDALAFLVACAVSYAALRSRALARRRRLERLADIAFMGALALMVVVAAMVTWTLA